MVHTNKSGRNILELCVYSALSDFMSFYYWSVQSSNKFNNKYIMSIQVGMSSILNCEACMHMHTHTRTHTHTHRTTHNGDGGARQNVMKLIEQEQLPQALNGVPRVRSLGHLTFSATPTIHSQKQRPHLLHILQQELAAPVALLHL